LINFWNRTVEVFAKSPETVTPAKARVQNLLK
jgi:hypothetical protein